MINLLLATVGGVLIGVGVTPWLIAHYGKPKTTPNHARLIAKPGATLDLVSDDGVVQAKVILSNITYQYNDGTTVLFEDYFKYKERVTARWLGN